ncbi:BRICHOS domain-containing protein 5 [Falco rusticolus]|uniref:BRICHOS domain-containing protein 5 n=1 Tax=Falco rusticolus TaxID=120794 RepID=UPI0018869D63|nr:BRICHOS domain-containing protein 5 [Falco rusticolus]
MARQPWASPPFPSPQVAALRFQPPQGFPGTPGVQDHAQSQSVWCQQAELQARGALKRRMEGQNGTGTAAPADTRIATHFTAPSRTFWIILSIALFFAVVGISIAGVLSFSPSSAQAGLQLVQLTLQGQHDPLRNQTALVDPSRSTVTYYITSQSNHTAVVLYDSRNGYVCYKPVEQRACYLRRMDTWDLQTLQTSSNLSEQRADRLLHQNNQTKYYREFLGVLAGEQVDPNSLGEAVQTLCEQTSIFWVRRGEGPGKQRLIYLCIDICFPSNICVSICFYYLPE